jgi:hypothetical protein
MTEEIWDKNDTKSLFALELERAKEYLREKERVTPKPKEYKKLTTLSDKTERMLLSDIKIKEEIIEIISNPRSVNAWATDIIRLRKSIEDIERILKENAIDSEV